jgi:hypothetical protein
MTGSFSPSVESPCLLAVDLGIRTGIACFHRDGRLAWYRSSNVGSRARLKKAVESVLDEADPVGILAIEGGGDLADPWISSGHRRGVDILQVSAEDWRHDLLLKREQESGAQAKKNAGRLARAIIDWADARKPTSLRHDAAEAICLGFWAILQAGWINRNDVSDLLPG